MEYLVLGPVEIRRDGQARALSGRLQRVLLGVLLARANQLVPVALALLVELGDRQGQAHVLDSLGYIHHQRGDHQQALTNYQRALELIREIEIREAEGSTLDRLGDTHQALGDLDTAEYVWQQALAIFTELDHPEMDQVRAKLRDQR